GQVVGDHLPADLVDARAQVLADLLHHLGQVHRFRDLVIVAGAAVGEEILYQPGHAQGGVGGAFEVARGFGVEGAPAAVPHQVEVGGDHAQGFLQVVAGDVGEL